MMPTQRPLVNHWRHAFSHVAVTARERLRISRERVHQIENEALQKLRRLDGERLFAHHQEL